MTEINIPIDSLSQQLGIASLVQRIDNLERLLSALVDQNQSLKEAIQSLAGEPTVTRTFLPHTHQQGQRFDFPPIPHGVINSPYDPERVTGGLASIVKKI